MERFRPISIFVYRLSVGVIALLSFCVCAAQAQPLRIAVGANIPPYVLADQDRGIEVDIIRAVYAYLGMPIEIRYLPDRRLPHDLQGGALDAACVYSNFDSDYFSGANDVETYSSHTTISFHNTAITLGDGPDIDEMADLSRHSVISFINARRYLGKEFERAVNPNRRYMEVSDQSLQVELLYSRRFKVVVSDKRIFMYWLRKFMLGKLHNQPDGNSPVVFHDIFSECNRCLVFVSKEQCDLFNKGLAAVKSLGTIQNIITSYTDSRD